MDSMDGLYDAQTDDEVLLYNDEERLYHSLSRYIRYLAGKYGRKGHWLLNPEDLEAELWLTLARVYRKYEGRPYGDLFSLSKRSIGNCIKSLLGTAFGTHRKAELLALSLDDDEYGSPEADCLWLPNAMREAHTRLDFEAHFNKLSPFDVEVLLAYAGRNETVGRLYMLYRQRRLFVFADANMELRPRTVAQGLDCEEQAVLDSLDRICVEFSNLD